MKTIIRSLTITTVVFMLVGCGSAGRYMPDDVAFVTYDPLTASTYVDRDGCSYTEKSRYILIRGSGVCGEKNRMLQEQGSAYLDTWIEEALDYMEDATRRQRSNENRRYNVSRGHIDNRSSGQRVEVPETEAPRERPSRGFCIFNCE